jgi:small GTP-binding protein
MKEIIFVGRSNVGKSTLITALTGKKLPAGRRPGVTRKPAHVPYQNIQITDMPGYGFMSGASEESQEAIKDNIVHYIENHAGNIILAVMVVDSKSFAQIVDRWSGKNEIPVDVELFEFLHDVNIDVVVAANKIDKVKSVDETLNGIAERLGMMPPWKQWLENLVPLCAKKGEVSGLKKLIQKRLEDTKKERT